MKVILEIFSFKLDPNNKPFLKSPSLSVPTSLFLSLTTIKHFSPLVLSLYKASLSELFFFIRMFFILFENKLSIEYIRNFEQILPLPTSESYSISCKILMCFITFYNKINDISDDNNDFNLLTNKIRLSIEYIVRKNIYIENQSTRDGDCIWFLWNIILQLSQSPFINILYKLFIFEWKSNCKKKRLGLLYGSVFLIKYKDINWTDTDLENFDKIKNLSKNFMINIKEKYPKTVKKNKVTYSNINIWDNYIPINKN